MKLRASIVSIVSAAALAPAAHATQCYSIYDARNALVYQSTTAPIDLSGSVSTAMARRFPARALVIADAGICREVGSGPATAATLRSSSPDSAADGSLSFDAMAPRGRADETALRTTRRSGTALR